jgi:hypothetical protein
LSWIEYNWLEIDITIIYDVPQVIGENFECLKKQDQAIWHQGGRLLGLVPGYSQHRLIITIPRLFLSIIAIRLLSLFFIKQKI